MLEVAREKLAVLERSGHVGRPFDLVDDPPLTPPFDLAISQLVLHHCRGHGGRPAAISALLRPGGRLALSDLDTEDGSFHDPDAEGIHHLGFDRDRAAGARARLGFADVGVQRPRTSTRTSAVRSRCSC